MSILDALGVNRMENLREGDEQLTRKMFTFQFQIIFQLISNLFGVPFILRKAGRVWRGGARETRQPRVALGRLLSKWSIY